ncbi:helix-turn-helix transcriptional regulator [Pseudomonas sp. GD03944]|uniref:AraC family transcriptional regulator n=1 Tax=Pseudomonas sp. GD03944 TaxID=2975409 RepID=UPI00244A2D47|nr:helix-turn-helix transcriptional regulator [Pseudomonas sp. GD03944]MDH1265638.1 helix-turn-helix transcriptional regulator [Pseudomonas sp. GD03944]
MASGARVQHLHLPPFTHSLPAPLYFRTARMPAEATYPTHRHVWGEFVYAFSGVMEVALQHQHFLVPRHYGVWLPPGVEHRGMNRGEACHCSLYVSAELTGKLPATPCALTVTPLLRAVLNHLRQHPDRGAGDDAHQRLLQVAVDQLGSAECAGSYLPASRDPVLEPVLQALQDNPGDTRTIAELARAVHSTERTLMRRSQRELGMTLSEWRQRLCVLAAMQQLEVGLSVESIAHDLGYSSVSAFIAMFRRLMGVTPDEYRKERAGVTPG